MVFIGTLNKSVLEVQVGFGTVLGQAVQSPDLRRNPRSRTESLGLLKTYLEELYKETLIRTLESELFLGYRHISGTLTDRFWA